MEKSKEGIQEQQIDLISITRMFLRGWVLFVICLFVSLTIAFLVNTFVAPQYQASSSILFKNSRNRTYNYEFLAGEKYFTENKDFNNELLVLQSTPLIKEVIRKNNFHVSYFEKEDHIPKRFSFAIRETYKRSPFIVIFDEDHPQPVNLMFYLAFGDAEGFYINAEGFEVDIYDYREEATINTVDHLILNGYYRFGDEIQGDFYSFNVLPNTNYNSKTTERKDFYFCFYDISRLASHFKRSLIVEPQDLEATIAEIRFRSSSASKAVDFVNGLTKEYLQQNLNKKNHLSLSTIQYIDNQLAEISDSLIYTEQTLQNFRRDFQVMDISEKASRLYEQLQQLQAEQSELEKKSRYYQHLNEYFTINKDRYDLLAPSAMGIEDPNLNNLISELTAYNSEKNTLIQSNQQRSPRVQTLNILITNLKASISENINYNINTSMIQHEDLSRRIQQTQYEINNLPQTQRQLVGIERKFKLNDAVYTYLLEKRAEAQIASAANLPDCEIMEDAKYGGQVYPRKNRNYLLAIFCGLFFPASYLQLRKSLNKNINDRQELERSVKIPFAGKIFHHKNNSSVVFMSDANERVADNFRSLRTNLEFYAKSANKKVFLVTSSMSKEGKSFISLNLGSAFAKNGHKVVVLGFDLRKPSVLYRELSEESFLGLSSYLIDEAKLDDILIATPLNNLYLITAGIIPPNPLELISSEKTGELIATLRESFDCIIIDSPPVGFIPDAFVLMQYSDLNLYIVRHNYTHKKIFTEGIREIEHKNISDLFLVYNDEKVPKDELKYTQLYYTDRNSRS